MQKSDPRLRKLLVASAALAGAVAVYAAAGFLAVPLLVADLARDWVRSEYGRELQLGEVRFNPFSLTLEVDGLVLPDADGSTPMVAFDRLLLDLEANSAWRRALSFGAIRLDGLAVDAVVRPGGALNLAALAESATAPEPAAPEPEPLPRLFIGELALADGRLRFEDRDRPEPYVAELKPLTFRLTNFSTYIGEGERYELDATLFDTSRFAWRGTLKADPLASDGEFTLEGLPLPRLAAFLGEALRLEVTRGLASVRGRYRFVDRPSGPDVEIESGEVAVTDLAIRDRGESVDYVDLDKVSATGLRLSLAKSRAVVGAVVLDGGSIQAWLTPAGELKRSGILDPLVTEPGVASAADAAPAPGAEPPGAPVAPGSAAWQVAIPRIQVRNLALSLEDRSIDPAPVFTLAPLAVDVTGYSTAPGTKVKATLSGTVNGRGTVAVQADVALDTLAAEADVEVDGLPLALAQPYLARQTSLTLTDGLLGAKGRVTYADAEPEARLAFTGDVSVAGLRTVDNVLREDFVKWQMLRLVGVEYAASPAELRIRQVEARSPFARIIIGPDGTTNVSAILAGPGATAVPVPGPTIAPDAGRDTPPVAVVAAPPAAAEAPAMPVRIGTVRITDGSARFADFTTRPNFAIGIEKLAGTVTGLSSRQGSRATVDLAGQVDRFSPVTIRGEVNPLAAETFLDMGMTFRNVELTSFSPYSGRFAGYAIRQGKLSVDLNYKVNDRKLAADHRFVIDQLELGDKVESPDAVSLPLKLAVALLKDRNGVIDLDLPVTGDLDDPQFRVGPIVWKVLVNLLTKAVTAPFALLGRLVGGGEEINRVGFPPGQATPDASGIGRLDALVKALGERPGLRLSVPAVYNAAADAPALQQAVLERLLVADRRAEAGGRQAAEALDYASLAADPGTHLRLLTARYRQAAGPEAPLPGAAADATPAASIALLEAALRASLPVTEADYYALARARAESVQARLLTDTGLDPGRVFLTAPAEGTAQDGAVVMELALE